MIEHIASQFPTCCVPTKWLIAKTCIEPITKDMHSTTYPSMSFHYHKLEINPRIVIPLSIFPICQKYLICLSPFVPASKGIEHPPFIDDISGYFWNIFKTFISLGGSLLLVSLRKSWEFLGHPDFGMAAVSPRLLSECVMALLRLCSGS